jgi:microcin C transport system permease protein
MQRSLGSTQTPEVSNESNSPVSYPVLGEKRFLGIRVGRLAQRRWDTFKSNRRAFWSLWIFLLLCLICFPAELIANDKPLIVRYDNQFYFPVFRSYPETIFGGTFTTQADYRDPFVKDLIKEKGWLLFPIIPFSHDTVNYDLAVPSPAPPSRQNWLGTDDEARDVLANVIYGFRISVLFAFILTFISSIIGIAIGAAQGYFGGRFDLFFQRFMEVWGGMPELYLLIILASIVQTGFWVLLGFLLLFSWMGLVGLVRAEVLRVRNFDFVRAARAVGVSDLTIMFRHVLPNAMVSVLTYLPFNLVGVIGTLTLLDFLGFGFPPSYPSLGELLNKGKANLQAPWLGLTGFFTLSIMLTLLVFIGEGVRDAFDIHKAFRRRKT